MTQVDAAGDIVFGPDPRGEDMRRFDVSVDSLDESSLANGPFKVCLFA